MKLRFLLIPTAVIASAAVPPGDQANLNPGNFALRGSDAPVMPHFDDFKFGDDSSGHVDIDTSHLRGRPPLVVQITAFGSYDLGYGWYGFLLHRHGYRLARLFPEQGKARKDGNALAASMARGIAALLAKADKYGFDPQRIILTSSDVGGDIAVLLATDASYFEQAGVPFASIRGVIVLGGAGFDLPTYLAAGSHYRRRQIEDEIGKDPAVQARISALHHVAPPNAPAFLFEVVKHDKDAAAQAEAMASALTQAGAQAQVEQYDRPKTDDRTTDLGYPTNPANGPLLRFLEAAAGQP